MKTITINSLKGGTAKTTPTYIRYEPTNEDSTLLSYEYEKLLDQSAYT